MTSIISKHMTYNKWSYLDFGLQPSYSSYDSRRLCSGKLPDSWCEHLKEQGQHITTGAIHSILIYLSTDFSKLHWSCDTTSCEFGLAVDKLCLFGRNIALPSGLQGSAWGGCWGHTGTSSDLIVSTLTRSRLTAQLAQLPQLPSLP